MRRLFDDSEGAATLRRAAHVSTPLSISIAVIRRRASRARSRDYFIHDAACRCGNALFASAASRYAARHDAKI